MPDIFNQGQRHYGQSKNSEPLENPSKAKGPDRYCFAIVRVWSIEASSQTFQKKNLHALERSRELLQGKLLHLMLEGR